MLRTMAVVLVLVAIGSSNVMGCGMGFLLSDPEEAVRKQGVEILRAMGYSGLQVALDELTHLQQTADAEKIDAVSAKLQRCRTAVDQVAGQRDAASSRLYWYTDLEKAKAAAAESEKPILSLRLLGKLTDQYSCANSRFFRTALYVNTEISDTLRERFILHWQTVRPVPKVTIDFGDGRTLCRTLTGNSAHYLLSADGRPLDVLPGLYSPQAFHEWLERVLPLAASFHEMATDANRKAMLTQYHTDRKKAIGDVQPEDLLTLTEQHRKEVHLDGSSVSLIRREHPNAFQAGEIATTKRIVEDPILRLVRNFEGSIALDTVRNEYLLHRRIHEWFARGDATDDFDALNERVYTELFLTPSSDPWLGLAPVEGYTALDGAGLGVVE